MPGTRRGLYRRIAPLLVVCLADSLGRRFLGQEALSKLVRGGDSPHPRRIALGHDAHAGLGSNHHNQWRLAE